MIERSNRAQRNRKEDETTVVSVSDQIKVPAVKRLGINVGYHDQFGASQILKNVVLNPGFEAGEYGTVFIAEAGTTSRRMQADHWLTEWNDDRFNIGQPPGFWEGGTFEVVYGRAKGRSGDIAGFTHENNRYTYYMSNTGSWVGAGDAVFVRKQLSGFDGNMGEFNQADVVEIRPNSPGTQSLRLFPPQRTWQWSYTYHMDSFWRDEDQAAGKLFIVDGQWRLEVWAKGATDKSELEIRFEREGEQIFFSSLIPINKKWKKIVRTFTVPQGNDRFGPYDEDDLRPILGLKLRITTPGGGWIDDLDFQRAGQTNPTVFSDKYVNLLKQLKPGVLRNWGRQLGCTLDNQLAVPFARKANGHHPRKRVATSFHYSLHEFLELAQEVGSEPWYVIPPTFSTEDLVNLAAYLCAPIGEHPYGDLRNKLGQREPWSEVFDVIHLEYGNELWGSNDGRDQFIGSSLRGGQRLGQIAHDRFGELRASPFYQALSHKLNLVIGGQANAVNTQRDIESNSSHHDTVALAPYFGFLTTFKSYNDTYGSLFARAVQDVRTGIMHNNRAAINSERSSTAISVYELNFHTTTGDIPPETRNEFVAGLAGGLALPLYMLNYQRDMGVTTQAAFTSAQFSVALPRLPSEPETSYVRLWGLLRDVERTARPRPTWLGLLLANTAIRGDMHVVTQSGFNPTWRQPPVNGVQAYMNVPYIHSFAYKDGDNHALVLFNLDIVNERPIRLQLPQVPVPQAEQHMLTGSNIHDSNEETYAVRINTQSIADFNQQYEMNLPAHSLTLIEWKSAKFRQFMPAVFNS